MSTTIAEPGTTAARFDERIDEAERLIAEGDLSRAVHLLEELRRDALVEGDVEAVERIAAIARSSSDVLDLYQRRFDRLATKVEITRIRSDESIPTVPPEDDRPVGLVAQLADRIHRHTGRERLILPLVAHLSVVPLLFLLWASLVGLVLWWRVDDIPLAVTTSYLAAVAVLWFASLGLIVGRWVLYREAARSIDGASIYWFMASAFAFVPLLFLVSAENRQDIGLCRGPR